MTVNRVSENHQLELNTYIVLFCQSGVRSKNAANRIAAFNKNNSKIYSLDGGITAWLLYKKQN